MRPFVPLVAAVAWACASAPAFAGAPGGLTPMCPDSGSPRAGEYPPTWTLSFSDSDPYSWTAPATPGASSLYLWLVFFQWGGMSVAEFDVQATGGLVILGFSPVSGFTNFGTSTELLLAAIGCPQGPLLAGRFTLFDASGAGGRVCLANSAANGINVTVDCDPIHPVAWPNTWQGVSTDGSEPCRSGTVSARSTPWGAVKALYR